jgi:NAD(P)-dependent dehydrogenase (short-subunit alcohol dehydrogenase family)
MAGELNGKLVLVTGGGQGLGEAICRELAQDGAVVLACDRSERVHETVAAIRGDGGEAHALTGDIGDEADVRRLVEEGQRRGGLAAIVNNAGIDFTTDLESLSVGQWDAVMRTNLRGPFLLTKFALPQLRERKGDVVNVASTAAKRGWPNASAYHASKWGLLGLSQALHAELRQCGVRVTAVIAGGMRTPFLLDRFPDLDPNKLQEPRSVARAVRFALTQPAESVIAEVTVLPVQESSWP